MMDLLSLRWYLNYGRLNKKDSLKSNLKMISLDNGKMQKRNKQLATTTSNHYQVRNMTIYNLFWIVEDIHQQMIALVSKVE